MTAAEIDKEREELSEFESMKSIEWREVGLHGFERTHQWRLENRPGRPEWPESDVADGGVDWVELEFGWREVNSSIGWHRRVGERETMTVVCLHAPIAVGRRRCARRSSAPFLGRVRENDESDRGRKKEKRGKMGLGQFDLGLI